MREDKHYAVNVSGLPDGEPVTLEEAKLHLRIDDETEDVLIESLVATARQWIEEICNCALLTQTVQLQMDQWPTESYLRMPKPPLRSVTSIAYIDEDDTDYTMDLDDLIVDTASKPGRIVLKAAADWPTESLRAAAGITITYSAGYGAAADVPKPIRQAIMLLIGHWYENRETVAVASGINVATLPFTVQTLLANYRMRG